VTPLTDDDIRTALVGLPLWGLADGQIVAEYRFADFAQAVAFVVAVAFEAERADHHPDIDVRYNRVRIALSTHSAGGVTDKDLELATVIEGVAGRQTH
jgi:4a-hydroxytetrahydrobiopterin dehydratase